MVNGGSFRKNTPGTWNGGAIGSLYGSIAINGGSYTENSGDAIGGLQGTVTVAGGEIFNNNGHGVRTRQIRI